MRHLRRVAASARTQGRVDVLHRQAEEDVCLAPLGPRQAEDAAGRQVAFVGEPDRRQRYGVFGAADFLA